jgi:hypothetical protein
MRIHTVTQRTLASSMVFLSMKPAKPRASTAELTSFSQRSGTTMMSCGGHGQKKNAVASVLLLHLVDKRLLRVLLLRVTALPA